MKNLWKSENYKIFKCKLFSIVYRKYLWNDFYKTYDRVIKVHNWRTARIENYSGGQRKNIIPSFTILWIKFN